MRINKTILLPFLFWATLLHAQNRFFNSASSGTTWDNGTTTNWGTVTGGPYNATTFGTYNIAQFEGTGATITSAGVNINGATFAANGYTIQSGTVTLGSPGGGPLLTVNSGISATISAPIAKAGGGTIMRKEGAGTLTLSGSTVTVDHVYVNAGTMIFSGGTMAVSGSDFVLSNIAASATYNQTAGTVNYSGANFLVGNNGGAADTSTFSISAGTFNASSAALMAAVRNPAVINVSGTGVLNVGGLTTGHSNLSSNLRPTVINLSGGTMNVTGGNNILGNDDEASTTINQTAGVFNLTGTGYFYMGNSNTQTTLFNLSGGTFSVLNSGAQYLAVRSTAVLNVSGTANVAFGNLQIGHPSVGGTGTVNLDGGTLTLASMGRNNGTANFNFNGGTLKASANTTTFLQGLTTTTVKSNGALIDTQAFNVTIAQPLLAGAPSGGLTKSGTGKLTLSSNANTYTGTTAISQGTLEVTTGVGSINSASAITVAASTALTYTLNGATIANTVSGTGAWNLNVVSGAVNNYALTGSNSGFTGTMNIGSGARLVVGSGYTTSAGKPGSAATIQVASGGTLFYISGSGAMTNPITINGDGVSETSPGPYGALRVDGATYDGNVTLGGNARIGTASGNGTLSGSITIGANTLTLNNSGSNLTFTGNLTATSAGSVVKTGSFTTILSGNNSGLNGTFTISQSNVFFNSATASSASAAWVVNAGTLSNSLTGNRTYNLGSLGGTGGSVGNNVGSSAIVYSVGALGTSTSYTGTIVDSVGGGGTTGLVKVGGGTQTLGGLNTFTGGLAIKAGTLAATTSTGALGNSGAGSVTLGDTGGTANATLTGDGRTFANPLTVAAGSSGNILTLGNSGNSSTVFSGLISQNNTSTRLTLKGAGTGSVNVSNTISGNGGLAISSDSTGTVTLGGANTFQGGVLFNSGTLNLNNNTALGNGAGTFTINGGTILKNTSGSTKTVTNNNPITLNGDFTFSGSSNLNLGAGAVSLGSAAGTARMITGTTADTLTFGGVISNGATATGLTKAGTGTLVLSGASDYTGAVAITGGTLSVNTVASPATAQALGKGTSAVQISNGGTLSITGGGTTSRGLSLTTTGGGLNVSAGTATITGTIIGDTNSADFTKSGAGTFNQSGSGNWSGNTFITGGIYNVTSTGSINNSGIITLTGSSTLNINTGTQVRAPSLALTAGSLNLNAGTLRTNGITVAGGSAFTWGAATLTVQTANSGSSGSVDRTGTNGVGGAASGPVVREGTILNVTAGALTAGPGSTLDLGELYVSGGQRYDQFKVTGSLTIASGATLQVGINPYFLRPSGPNDVTTGDWGTLRLVMADSITGTFAITGITSDFIGWTSAGSGTNTGTDPALLPINTYFVEYATSGIAGEGIQSGAAILFHYHVSGSVPEPASGGLLIAGAALLRALSRRRAPHA